jgi:DNA primase
MAFMNSVVEDIKSRVNIVDFIGQYLRLIKAGANFRALCPFHHEKTPSFMVSEEKQIWHCFGCGKGGDIFGFLMEMESLNFKEALKVLADRAGVEIPKYGFEREQTTDKNKILEILELAAKFYEAQLWKGMGKEKILDYLHNRAIKDEIIREFRLGYAPAGWRNLLKFLIQRNYKIEDIEKTGLLVEKEGNSKSVISNSEKNNGPNNKQPITNYYDRFRDRIIFPIADLMGKVIGFSARVAPGGDETQAKYVNTPETLVYYKSRVLYGIDKAKHEIKDKDEAILVEGNMDVIAAHQAGIKNTVAVSGTALTHDQLEIIKRYSQNLKMFFDMDKAGQAAARRSAEAALEKGLNVYIVESAHGKDAADISAKDPKMFENAVRAARPAMECFVEDIFTSHDKNNSIEKKKITAEALNLIRHIGNEIERNYWVKKLAAELEVDFKILADALNKITGRKEVQTIKSEESESISCSREELIRKKIIGLMLSYPEVWKHLLEKFGSANCLAEDRNFQLMEKGGPSANFQADKFLGTVSDEETRMLFGKLAFDCRYRFSEKFGAEELDAEKALNLAKLYVAELEKETKRRKLENILKDIKKAEKQKNKEELTILVEEFNKLSQELR